jgi:signal transduction histidine kinase
MNINKKYPIYRAFFEEEIMAGLPILALSIYFLMETMSGLPIIPLIFVAIGSWIISGSIHLIALSLYKGGSPFHWKITKKRERESYVQLLSLPFFDGFSILIRWLVFGFLALMSFSQEIEDNRIFLSMVIFGANGLSVGFLYYLISENQLEKFLAKLQKAYDSTLTQSLSSLSIRSKLLIAVISIILYFSATQIFLTLRHRLYDATLSWEHMILSAALTANMGVFYIIVLSKNFKLFLQRINDFFKRAPSNHKLMIHRIPDYRRDEFGALSKEINDFFAYLQHSLFVEQDRSKSLKERIKEIRKDQEKLLESERSEAIGRLAVSLTHKINTPLGNALLVIDQLESQLTQGSDHPLPIDFLRISAELLRTDLKKMQALMDRIQNIRPADTPSIWFYPQSFIRGQIAYFQSLYPLKVDFSIHGDKDLEILGKPQGFLDLIQNLIENSYRHGFRDHQEPGPAITFNLKNNNGEFSFYYQDNGRGLSRSAKSRVFEPLVSESLNNSGLGLYQIKTHVEQILEGDVKLFEPQDGGFGVEITIPRSHVRKKAS